MPSKTSEIELETEQYYEGEARPTIFEQTPIEPKTKLILYKNFKKFHVPLKLPCSNITYPVVINNLVPTQLVPTLDFV